MQHVQLMECFFPIINFKRIIIIIISYTLMLFDSTSLAGNKEIKILVLGDSLAAGYGLMPEDAFPAQLEKILKKRGRRVRVINAGVSGDTSAGGKARLNWVLADKPDMVIVELGANDGLRGLDPRSMIGNLDYIIKYLKLQNIKVLLAGMRAPPNLGPQYSEEFNSVFPYLAKKHEVALFPFFLEGVAAVPSLNQSDGIHPNRKGVRKIVDQITPFVLRLLKDLGED